MDRKTVIAIVMSSLLTATAVVAFQASAADSPASNDVECGNPPTKKTAANFIRTQLEAGRTEVRVGGGDGVFYICAW